MLGLTFQDVLCFLSFIWFVAIVFQYVVWVLLPIRKVTQTPKKANSNLDTQSLLPGISIIVCARNAAKHLLQNLPLLLQQQYPLFEVLVVDDASTDNTHVVLQELQSNYPNLRSVRIAKKTSLGKKAALQLGLSEAQHAVFLLTDADCKPSSPYWIANMAAALEQDTDLVLGVAPYSATKTFWLNTAIQYETLLTASLYLGAANNGLPYMVVGRNVLYRKSFINGARFDKNTDLASGDDDLLLNPLLHRAQVRICMDADALMWSDAPDTWHSWVQQKKRHLSTAHRYRWSDGLRLAGFSLSHALVYFLLPCFLLFATGFTFWVGAGLFCLRALLILRLFRLRCNAWQLPVRVPLLLVADLLWPLYYLYFALAALGLRKNLAWSASE